MSNAPNGVFIHESAWVDQPCEIGEGTRIWHFSHILVGAVVGRDCVIGQNVMIFPLQMPMMPLLIVILWLIYQE